MLESASIQKSRSSSERVAVSYAVSSQHVSVQQAMARRRKALQRGICASEFPSSQVHLFRCVKKLVLSEREVQS